tara:strand:+ start:834 stop:1571 length:738 start_codon:yes stop_codon:yes gene_type:complete
MQEAPKCGIFKTTCDTENCEHRFGKSQEILICPYCNAERNKCQNTKPYIWVIDPDSGRNVNTGNRYDTCKMHSNRKASVGSWEHKNKETTDRTMEKGTDEQKQEYFLTEYVETGKFVADPKTRTGFVPKVETDSELFNVWLDEFDNPKMHDLRGELALLRTYLQFSVVQHGDYPEAKDIRASQKIIQQITDTIQNLIKLEAELKVLVEITDVQMMVERIIGVIIESNIPDSEKINIAEEIKKITQ